MARSISAQVTLAPGLSFRAEIANLTDASLFLSTKEALHFRELVTLSFAGITVQGEVALSSDEPLGVLIVFSAPAETKRQIHALSEDCRVISSERVRQRSATFEVKTAVSLPPEEPGPFSPHVLASDLVIESTAPRKTPIEPFAESSNTTNGAIEDAFEEETVGDRPRRNEPQTVPDPEPPPGARVVSKPSMRDAVLASTNGDPRRAREQQMTRMDPAGATPPKPSTAAEDELKTRRSQQDRAEQITEIDGISLMSEDAITHNSGRGRR
jgi:hypothetical protein